MEKNWGDTPSATLRHDNFVLRQNFYGLLICFEYNKVYLYHRRCDNVVSYCSIKCKIIRKFRVTCSLRKEVSLVY